MAICNTYIGIGAGESAEEGLAIDVEFEGCHQRSI
jgi:hypothetical protein